MTLRSDPYFLLDIPTIGDLTGRFKYRFFTKGETMYPASDDPTLDSRTRASFGIPRKIIIEIEDSEIPKDFE